MGRVDRRAFMTLTAFAVTGALLSGCTTVVNGSTTTITLNVTRIVSYATAGLSAAATIELALTLVPSLAPYMAAIKTVTALVQTAVTAFSKAVGSSITVTYNDANVKTLIDSILHSLQSLSSQITAATTAIAASGVKISQTVLTEIGVVNSSLGTIVSIFESLLTPSTAMSWSSTSPKLAMSESEALKNLKVA